MKVLVVAKKAIKIGAMVKVVLKLLIIIRVMLTSTEKWKTDFNEYVNRLIFFLLSKPSG